jgi:hypothetical protein
VVRGGELTAHTARNEKLEIQLYAAERDREQGVEMRDQVAEIGSEAEVRS